MGNPPSKFPSCTVVISTGPRDSEREAQLRRWIACQNPTMLGVTSGEYGTPVKKTGENIPLLTHFSRELLCLLVPVTPNTTHNGACINAKRVNTWGPKIVQPMQWLIGEKKKKNQKIGLRNWVCHAIEPWALLLGGNIFSLRSIYTPNYVRYFS